MSEFEQVIHTRRSVRGFLADKAVPRATLAHALELSQQTPSNCNVQPWRVYVASGAALERLRKAMLERFDSGDLGSPEDPIDTFPGDYRPLQIACAVELYTHMGIGRNDGPGRARAARRNYELFDAPHVAIVCMENHFGLGVALDVGMWVQTFMLALADAGVSSCPQAALRHYPNEVRKSLEIPASLRILCGISFGYEDPAVAANQSRQKREPFSHNVRFVES